MRYIKITGNLLDVLGSNARNMKSIGVEFLPQHQMIDGGKNVSYGKIVDEILWENFNCVDDRITYFDTANEVNSDIDSEYEFKLVVTDLNALKLDIELSGEVSNIVGYNPEKTLDSQENLLAILQHGDMMGIGSNKNRKADYFVE